MTAPGPDQSPDPFDAATLGPLRLRNRFVKAATFEGMTERGLATEGLAAFHRAVAAGGAGMSTVAYCAVSREGRGAPNQIVVREEAVPGLRAVVEAIHAEGAAAAVQLGHAGPVGAAAGSRGLSPSPMLSLVAMRRTRAATEVDLTQVIQDFDRSARLVAEAGFDSIELHFGHHYLVSAFHSPKWNRRKDEWGGSVENRARLGRQIARSVRATVGRSVAVTAKLNMDDGVKGGLGVEESLQIARLLQEDGALDALELTGGGSFANPMYLFRGEAPIRELAAAMPKAIGLGMRVFGKRFLPSYPYEEAYFLPQARRFRAELDLPLILLGGISRLDTVRAAMAEGFEFVAMARALLREPDLIESWRTDPRHASGCDHSNRCMATIYGGTHCVLVPEEERPGVSA